MGPLTKRIAKARNERQTKAIMVSAQRHARIAVAIVTSEDGGLLVHREVEAQNA